MTRVAVCFFLTCFFILPAAADQPPEFKEAYRTYTELMEQGKEGEAIPHAKKALDIALKSDAFDDETRGKLAFNLGYANVKDARLNDAVEAFTTAINLLRKAGGKEKNLIGEALVYRGICHRSLLNAHEAEQDLEQAVKLLTDPAPAVQIVRAEALENLAWVMVQQRRHKSAGEYASEAHAIYSRLLPKHHPRTLRVLVVMSASAWVGGKSREARDLLAQATAEAEKAGIAPEGSDRKEGEREQFTLNEMVKFHWEVANLYELMNRKADAEYHDRIASDLAKGIRRGALRVKPIKRTPPSYPSRASRRGKIGWVILEFTVRKDGSTSDIRVIDAAPEGFFEEAAIKAAKNWTYEPPTEDGKPTDVPGVRTTIQFLLKDGQ